MPDKMLPQQVKVVDPHIDRAYPVAKPVIAVGVPRQIEPLLCMHIAGLAAQVQAARFRDADDRLGPEPGNTAVEVPRILFGECELP